MNIQQTTKFLRQAIAYAIPVAAVAVVLVPDLAHAAGTSSGSDPFQSMLTTTTSWVQGSMGQLVSLSAIAYGLGAGLFKNSVGGAVTGVGGGMVLNASPTIVSNTFGAAIPMAAAVSHHLPSAVQAVIG
ncbi:MAG: hypothetical protein F8N36_16010 [Desulfovibrio sp.]|uniref:TraA family conjugative transfer protein n=1 Tax=Desulfovibrio sp. TaxID=885 RepID=UPI00135D4162|nr:TraA family conjugative transfer protein [Desulfovibrio sp.]MTJ94344.1 hypothetical protein [Desulfovibrio sp.]